MLIPPVYPVNCVDLWGLQCQTGSDQQDAGNASGIGEIPGYPETGDTSWRAANAALEWRRYKGFFHDSNGNTNTAPDGSGGQHRDWYADRVQELSQ